MMLSIVPEIPKVFGAICQEPRTKNNYTVITPIQVASYIVSGFPVTYTEDLNQLLHYHESGRPGLH